MVTSSSRSKILHLAGESAFANLNPPANRSLGQLPKVTAITVNTVHGSDRSIASVTHRFQPQVESMEGAAFMSACLIQHAQFAQVRAVSNFVERRNRGAWKITEAIANLNAAALRILEALMRDTLTLGFSPCPNDCFMFDAIVNARIDLEGLEFSVRLADVEALNAAAFASDTDVTKLSYHAYAFCCEDYVLLDAGSALGRNCGPLLISKRPLSNDDVATGRLRIAIPGKYTTANFLLGLAFPQAQDKTPLVFSAIESAVLDEQFDAGLIIHENRFTYEAKGLRKIIDLGSTGRKKPARRSRLAASSSNGPCRTN